MNVLLQVLTIVFLPLLLSSQIVIEKQENILKDTIVKVNPNNGAKTSIFCGGYFVEDKEGQKIMEGDLSGACSKNDFVMDGSYIARYKNGSIKEQGFYECGRPTGTWISFYEDGAIRKVESFSKSFPSELFESKNVSQNLENEILQDGPYVEYYPNGNLKLIGRYKVFEVRSDVDTIKSIDPESYVLTEKVIHGDFWLVKSLKYGHWIYYNEDGEMLKKVNYMDDIHNMETREVGNLLWGASAAVNDDKTFGK